MYTASALLGSSTVPSRGTTKVLPTTSEAGDMHTDFFKNRFRSHSATVGSKIPPSVARTFEFYVCISGQRRVQLTWAQAYSLTAPASSAAMARQPRFMTDCEIRLAMSKSGYGRAIHRWICCWATQSLRNGSATANNN